ncbi:TPA: hypothetical protein N0F65_006929 [Lagenidium giganteum]|uniref:Uncharacterized protein n=1 Tax=Lagenidium giganteum TaxID=4803 RepID=A0AAV2ZE36_9STRA|nr:TPA: hypothetical protein N0F65_006929 [Lagenidium giganteum]
MGNTAITSVCSRNEFEDITDAEFDFISVSMPPARTSRQQAAASTRVAPYVSASHVVAVVPIAADTSKLPRQSPVPPAEQEKMSFNERLNLITWDPESMPSYAKRQEVYVFDEYAPRSSQKYAAPAPAPARSSVLRRAIQTVKAQFTTGSGKKPGHTTKVVVDLSTEKANCKLAEDPPSKSAAPIEASIPSVHVSESANSEDASIEIEAQPHVEQPEAVLMVVDRPTSLSAASMPDDTYYSLKKTTSWASDFAGSDVSTDDEEDDEAFFYTPASCSLHVTNYLCQCGDCPHYSKIDRAVTNSTCWMNERERRSMCRILQAYSTYNEAVEFRREMISCAEECMLMSNGNEDAAFNSFVFLAQQRWE